MWDNLVGQEQNLRGLEGGPRPKLGSGPPKTGSEALQFCFCPTRLKLWRLQYFNKFDHQTSQIMKTSRLQQIWPPNFANYEDFKTSTNLMVLATVAPSFGQFFKITFRSTKSQLTQDQPLIPVGQKGLSLLYRVQRYAGWKLSIKALALIGIKFTSEILFPFFR